VKERKSKGKDNRNRVRILFKDPFVDDFQENSRHTLQVVVSRKALSFNLGKFRREFLVAVRKKVEVNHVIQHIID
jgi:hypothetical protein